MYQATRYSTGCVSSIHIVCEVISVVHYMAFPFEQGYTDRLVNACGFFFFNILPREKKYHIHINKEVMLIDTLS